MRLWNDYEGTTIAGAYPIEKLIRPEGRSAFFSTSNGTGTPAVIRLIESINDESEILARWKTVAELKETHLVTLKSFGQTIFEGTPLIYVLMESTEADLASILRERALTVDETREIAVSLVEAVQALHATGIIHEHIEPANVLATGDIVKLRSDCIRETPEGEEGIALKRQDVHDLAIVLLQALTRHRSLDAVGAARLPAPFDPIIRNGINGTWGLAQIAAALTPPVAEAPKAPVVPASAKPQQMPLALPDAPQQAAPAASAPPFVTERSATPPIQRDRITVPVADDPTRRRLWIAIAPVVVVILAALGWHFLHKPAQPSETPQPITTLSEAAAPQPAVPSAPAIVPSAQPQSLPATGDATRQWRVIAFTYNRQDQAQHKADQLAQRDGSLRPEIFTPTGRSPYLVTVGGAMTRAEAAAFRQKAQSEGLPRDIYIQNYRGR